jgi:hypothetical protein
MPVSSLSMAAETTTACEDARGFGIAVGGGAFFDVTDVEHGFGGQELRLCEDARLIIVAGDREASGFALAEQFQRLPEHGGSGLGFLVALRGFLLEGGDALFEGFEVGQ